MVLSIDNTSNKLFVHGQHFAPRLSSIKFLVFYRSVDSMKDSTSTSVPDEILVEFLRQAADTLDNQTQLESPAHSLAEVRQMLLSQQTACLQAVVEQFSGEMEGLTVDLVQKALRQSSPSSIGTPREDQAGAGSTSSVVLTSMMERMNESARLAFCRLVLYSECLRDGEKDTRDLQKSGELKDEDVRTFCGLCQAVVKLPSVVTHLRAGGSIFADLPQAGETATILPQKRLEYIQRMFLKALGYDPDFATREIKAKFYQDTLHNNEDTMGESSPSLQSTFTATVAAMEAALVEATAASTHDTFFAGHHGGKTSNDDGVTKVVAVSYSEKLIDETTGEEILTLSEDASPRVETMDGKDGAREPQQESAEASRERERREQIRLSQQASLLQQEILGELLTMRDEERDAKLQQAREASQSVLQKAMQLPPGPERIAVLTSVTPETQRLMAMHKVWDGMLAANGGVPPKLHTQRPPE